MKITHLTTLKHKLQWLLLLAALLGVSQGVWADYFPNSTIYVSSEHSDAYKIHLWRSSDSSNPCHTWWSDDELMTSLGSIENRNYFSFTESSCNFDMMKVYHNSWSGGTGDKSVPSDGRNRYDIQLAKWGYYYPNAEVPNIILKAILEDGKIAFYMGTTWSAWDGYLKYNNATDIELPCNASFTKGGTTVRYSPVVIASKRYYISNSSGWSGDEMNGNAVAGYAYIATTSNDVCGGGTDHHVCDLSAPTYSDAYFGSTSGTTSITVSAGETVTFTSQCNSTTSAIGTNLRYDYYLKNGSGDYTRLETVDVNSTSAIQTTHSTSGMSAGTYYIYPLLVDKNNSAVAIRPSSGNVLTLTILSSCTAPTSVTASATNTCLTRDGSDVTTGLSVTKSGGDGDISYTWSIPTNPGEGAGVDPASGTSTTATFTKTGTYTFLVTASCSGTDRTSEVTVNVYAAATQYAVTSSADAAVCPGTSVTITLANTQSGYTYELYKDGVAVPNSQQARNATGSITWTVNPTETSRYTVQAWKTECDNYKKGMSNSVDVEVKGDMAISAEKTSGITPYEPVSIAVTGTSVTDISWSKSSDDVVLYSQSTKFPSSTANPVTFKAPEGEYSVTVTATDDGCSKTRTVSITVGSDDDGCN